MSNIVRKNQTVELIADEAGLSRKAVKDTLDCLINLIGDSLAQGKTVSIKGLGTFSAKDTKARIGRNPRTGETLNIDASKRVHFAPSQFLKDSAKKQMAIEQPDAKQDQAKEGSEKQKTSKAAPAKKTAPKAKKAK